MRVEVKTNNNTQINSKQYTNQYTKPRPNTTDLNHDQKQKPKHERAHTKDKGKDGKTKKR
jgi:hypothetical protein